jgi:hypothetical protein
MEVVMLRFLGSVLSAVLGALSQFLWLFGHLFQTFCDAVARNLNIAPSVPPADDDGELAELADEDTALRGTEDLNLVRNWASAKLYGLEFPLPATTVGRWLSSLDDHDMERVIRADSAGVLDQHLAGRSLVPGLPPVGDEDQTRRWCERNRPAHRRPSQAVAPASPAEGYEPAHDAEIYAFRRAA